jgi:hypothetical protein
MYAILIVLFALAIGVNALLGLLIRPAGARSPARS